jgi:hypothetical protein
MKYGIKDVYIDSDMKILAKGGHSSINKDNEIFFATGNVEVRVP